MNIKPIKTEKDYEQALSLIDTLIDSEVDTPEGDMLDILATLVEVYEEEHFKIEPPDPIEAIKFRMEQEGLSRKDLEPLIGNRGRVSEVLAKKRSLTLGMIRKIHNVLGVPARVLIRQYK